MNLMHYQYFASLDPIARTVYYVMLGLFALMPLLVARKQDGS